MTSRGVMRCGYELIPVRENCSEISGVNDAVEIDIAAGLGGGSPCTEHAGQITRANVSIAIDIGSTQDQARFEQRKIERIDDPITVEVKAGTLRGGTNSKARRACSAIDEINRSVAITVAEQLRMSHAPRARADFAE